MSDTPKQVKTKINKYAFSGGKATIEEHRREGGRTDVDVPYQVRLTAADLRWLWTDEYITFALRDTKYLSFFEDSDEKLETIKNQYESGELLTGEMKAICIETLQKMVAEFQEVRSSLVLFFS
jgi:tryptophanyl-tRNA synthetase